MVIPDVSVVIPVYNGARTLGRTLHSVADQTLQDIEVIIVDDGSTDASLAVAESARPLFKDMRIVHRQRGGPERARNAGIEAARGAYIAPIDADDLWHPTYLEKMVAALRKSGGRAGFAYALFRRIDDDDCIISTPRSFVVNGFAFHQLVFKNAVGNGSGVVFSRSEALAVGGYETRFQNVGDNFMQLKLAWRGAVVCVPEYLVGYRLTPGSLSSNKFYLAERSLRGFQELADVAPESDRSVLKAAIARRAARATLMALAKRRAGTAIEFMGISLGADLQAGLVALLTPWRLRDPRRFLSQDMGKAFLEADTHPAADFEIAAPYFLRAARLAAMADERERQRRQALAVSRTEETPQTAPP